MLRRAEPSSATIWSACAAAVGGLLWIADWPLFLLAHGPTENNANRTVLGLTGIEWDQFLALPLALAAFGLVGVHRLQRDGSGRLERVGYALSLAGFALWGASSLVRLPPHPGIALLGAGLVVFGAASAQARLLPAWSRAIPLVLGLLLVAALAADAVAGRPAPGERVILFVPGGMLTHVFQGVGWLLLSYALLERREPHAQRERT